MLVILKYKKPNAKKKVQIDLNNERSASDLRLVLQYERDRYRINKILGNVFDFDPSYKLISIKIDGKKITVKELLELVDNRNTNKPLKLTKKIKKRMGAK